MKTYRYKNIFSFSSQSFTGHLEEYFAEYSEKYVAHLTAPRLPKTYNIVRVYKKGKLIEEKQLWSHHNIILYFLAWYIQHLYILFRYFKSDEQFYAIVFMPHLLFFSNFQKLLRKVEYVFFIGDYCPDKSFVIRLYERIRKYYHDRLSYSCYLSDTLNKLMNNGNIVARYNKKTVMWGVKKKQKHASVNTRRFEILFVGLVKESQGLDFIFSFLKTNKKFYLHILGKCDDGLYKKYMNKIKKLHIENQINFENRFFDDGEVEKISRTCKVGLALYDTGKMNMTYYTEPGKVKYYAELGLPIIMSNTSSIVEYVKKFHMGEIVSRDKSSLIKAISKISKNYSIYIEGLNKFNSYFKYERYYKSKFAFLET